MREGVGHFKTRGVEMPRGGRDAGGLPFCRSQAGGGPASRACRSPALRMPASTGWRRRARRRGPGSCARRADRWRARHRLRRPAAKAARSRPSW